MSYVESNLMPGEQLIHAGKVHWFIFVPGALMLFVALWLLASAVDDSKLLFGVILLLIGTISLLKALIYKVSTELAITSKRVIAKVGLISRQTVELNHGKVESFNIDQSIVGRLLGFGTVIVCGTGGGKTPISNIDAPLEFRRQAMKVVDEAASSPAPAVAAIR